MTDKYLNIYIFLIFIFCILVAAVLTVMHPDTKSLMQERLVDGLMWIATAGAVALFARLKGPKDDQPS